MADLFIPRSTPEEQGVPSKAIISFLERLKKQGQEHHSFMLLRHGHVIAEGSWYPYALEHYHMLFSLSKSVAATAVGIAAGEGLLSIEDYIVDIFRDELPEGYDPGYNKIKVKHLLSMTTGQKDCFVFSMNRKGNTWVEVFFNVPLVHKPGTKFMYNTGASYMLSAIISKLTGQSMIDYLTPRLFEPMGIEKPFSQISPQGIDAGGWGLYLKVEDIAKFGQLYLNKGIYNGKRLLPEGWVEDATSMHIDPEGLTPDWQVGYGYQIWQGRHGTFRGDGAFCQYVIVMPEQDAVLACTNGMHDGQRYMNTLYDVLLPYMNSESSLPEDKESYNRLQEMLNNLNYSPLEGNVSEAGAKKLYNKVFVAEENKYGYKEFFITGIEENKIRFDFKDNNGEYSVTAEGGNWYEGESTLKHSIGGPLTIGALESPGYRPQPVFASYSWEDDNRFKLYVRYAEAPTADVFTISIDDNRGISFLRDVTAVFEFEKREPVKFEAFL